MKKHNFTLRLVSPGDTSNHSAKVVFISGIDKDNYEFDEFTGNTREEDMSKATKAIQEWLSQQGE